MPLFDAYIFVDWSAANRPHPLAPAGDAPWVGEATQVDTELDVTYHRTRQAAVGHILERLLHHAGLGRRVLVGFDFPYGYPKGLASALALPDRCAPWWNIWAELSCRLKDKDDNSNNRFKVASDLNQRITRGGSGPFWGCPEAKATQHLSTHGPGFPFHTARGVQLKRLRLCEVRLGRVQEAWGLFGKGRVGSQAMTGIPRVHYLRRHPQIALFSKVWPFETGFIATPSPPEGPFILHAEIWPGIVEQQVQEMAGGEPLHIRDRAQVRAMCQWAELLDEKNTLGVLFDRPVGLDDAQAQSCVDEEGWILGACRA